MRLINFRIPAAMIGLALLAGTLVDSAYALPNGTYLAQDREQPTIYQEQPTIYQERRPVPRSQPRRVCQKYRGRDGRVYQRCFIVNR